MLSLHPVRRSRLTLLVLGPVRRALPVAATAIASTRLSVCLLHSAIPLGIESQHDAAQSRPSRSIAGRSTQPERRTFTDTVTTNHT